MNKLKTTMLMLSILLLLVVGIVSASMDHQNKIEEGKKFVESGIDCDELSDEQLEDIGMYYMEQMHPGEAHEMMDNMMGGGDSDNLKQMHIQMAKVLYCGESGGMMSSGGGMMGMMNMMGGGNMMGFGMMGNSYLGYSNLLNTLYVLLLLGLIILVYLGIIKLWKDIKKTKRR